MSESDNKKKSGGRDYLHPDGKPKLPPANEEERENLEKARESKELVKELKE